MAVRVITTVSTPEKAELSRQAGAVEVLDYPEDPEEFGAKIKELTDGGVAAVYDGVGAATFDASLASLRDPRHACAVRRVQRAGPAVRPAAAQRGRLTVSDPADARALHPHADEFAWRAGELLNAIAAGTINVTVSERYRLEDAEQAHRDLQGRKTVGSVVLVP